MRAETLAAEPRETLRSRPTSGLVEGRLGVGHFVRGLTALGLAQVMSWAGSVVAVVLMPRFLGAAGLGRYSVALSVIGFFLIASDMGIATFQAKEVAKNPDRAGELYVPATAARVALALVVALLAALTFHQLFTDPIIRMTGYVASGLIVTQAFQSSYATLQGLHRAPLLGLTTALNSFALAALTATVLFRGGGPAACAGATVGAGVVSQGVSTVLVLRHLRPRWSVSPRLMWRVVRGGLPFVVWSAAMTAYSQIDVVMLNLMTGPDVVGWFAAAERIVAIPAFVPSTVLIIGFPVLAASARDAVAFAGVARQVLRVTMLVSLPLALGLAILPQDITHVLRYPATFSHAWWPLRLLALQFPLVAADMVIGSALNARDRQRQWTVTAVSAAVFNPLVNLWAIPLTQHLFGNGGIGAAAVTVLTELFMMCVGLWLLPRDVFGWADVRMMVRILAACVPMAAAAFLLSGHFIAIPVLGAGVVYGVAVLATGAVTIRDVRALRLALPRRWQGGAAGSPE